MMPEMQPPLDPRRFEDGFDETDRETRWKTFTGDRGRDFGWDVLVDGLHVATLTAPEPVDMFWVGYRVEPKGGAFRDDEPLRFVEGWSRPGVLYRNRETGEIVTGAFAGGEPQADASSHIAMRALHSRLVPTWSERFRLWLRACWATVRARSQAPGGRGLDRRR